MLLLEDKVAMERVAIWWCKGHRGGMEMIAGVVRVYCVFVGDNVAINIMASLNCVLFLLL